MEKKKQQPCKTKKENGTQNNLREKEAKEIMTMLTENKVFSKEEPVEIIFSDRTVILSPDKKEESKKTHKK